MNLTRYNKLYVALVTFAGTLVAQQVITGKAADVVSAAIAAAGVFGVFAVPNAQPKDAVRYEPAWTPTVNPSAGNKDAQPSKALGRRPAKNAPALKFADHLTAVPTHPITDLAPNLMWPMDHNDTVGCCVVAGLDHFREVVYTSLGAPYTPWTDAELLELYQTQNPSFRGWQDGGTARDGGMDIQTFLEYLVAQGVILGFAKVDHTNVEQMKAAIYLGLGIVTGEVLTAKNLREQVWDHHPRDVEEGGHCTVSVGYDPAEAIVSWGALYSITDAFLARNIEEAWFVLTQAHVDHAGFREHFDLASFATAYTAMTGRPFPVTVTPPAPGPVDPPAPAPAPADGTIVLTPPADVLAKVQARAAKKHESPEAYVEHALEQYLK